MLRRLALTLQKSKTFAVACIFFVAVVAVRAETAPQQHPLVAAEGEADIAVDLPPRGTVHAPFNREYPASDLGSILSWRDPGKALSAVAYHRGLLIAPVAFDFGGGIGDGALLAYNVDDPRNPHTVFDSRDFPERYHGDEDDDNYLGDLGEMHALYFHQDYLYLTERGRNRNGFLILDLGPLYDDDPATLPEVVSRFFFPGIEKFTVYDGFSFSPAWVGGKYVYAPTGSTGLFIIDTTDLAEPRLLTHLTKKQMYNQVLRSVHPMGDMLVLSPAAIASAQGDIVLMDVSDPSQPNLINRHTARIGYQGILYGSKFYNGAFSDDRGTGKTAELIVYDLSDPQNITSTELARTEEMFKPEYIFVRDGDLYIGHYPGLSKWRVDGDEAELQLVAEPQHPPASDYGFVSPLGNLAVITSDHNVQSKFNIALANAGPDHTSPTLEYVSPAMGQRNVAATTKVGISFSDFIDQQSLENSAVLLREKATGRLIDSGVSHGMGIVHLVPRAPLKNNATYDVLVTRNLMDTVGNAYEGPALVSTFSTGAALTAYQSEITVGKPSQVGEPVQFSARIIAPADAVFEYSWDFGDGSAITSFTRNRAIEQRFDKPGNYNITLTAREIGNDRILRSTAVQVIHARLPQSRAVSSSTLNLDPALGRLYVANPDNDTITAFDTLTGQRAYESATGKKPVSLARIGNELWISSNQEDAILVHAADDGRLIRRIDLAYGSAPYGLAVNEQAGIVYAALAGSSAVLEINAYDYRVARQQTVPGPLRHLAFVPRKGIIIAPQFVAAAKEGGRVQWLDAEGFALQFGEALAPTTTPDGLSNGRGFPNFLGPVAVNPEQSMIWLPGKKDNLLRGPRRDGLPLEFDHTVRSVVVPFDLDDRSEPSEHRVDLDNSDFASAATFSAFGNILYVATMGSQTVTAIDAFDPANQSTFNSYGEGSIALVASPDGSRLYLHNQLSRSISVYDARADGDLQYLTRWMTVSDEKMAADVLNGKRLFHRSAQSQLSQEGYMSCSSCHADGAHDGRVWDLSHMGEGVRNTIDLRGKEGMKHGPLHWTGNFDEVQDFDIQLQGLNGGTGFLFDVVAPNRRSFFPSTAGMNLDLDDLAKYVTSLSEYPKSPHRNADGSMTPDGVRGRGHFMKLNCHSCHSGPTYTDSVSGQRHDVGTFSQTSGQRIGKPLDGLDTPSLIGLWSGAPYLHDGSAETLADVFDAGRTPAANSHMVVQDLTSRQQMELYAFLLQIDAEGGITAGDVSSTNRAPSFASASYQFDHFYRFDEGTHRIGRVQASDADSGQSLSYEIMPSVHGALFEIDEDTGEIGLNFKEIYLRNIANKALDIDRTYSFAVLVSDDGDFQQRSMVPVSVNVRYPKLYLTNQELNRFKRLSHKVDSGQRLSPEERAEFAQLRANIRDRSGEYDKYELVG